MLADWANTVVLVALGLGLGAAATLAQLLAPPEYAAVLRSRMPGEGLLAGTRRRADEQGKILRSGPRAFRLASQAQLAFVAVLVLTVWLSPVELGWWTLVLGVGAGVLVTSVAFRLARSGKLRVPGESRLDPLGDVEFSFADHAREAERPASPVH